MGIEAGTLIIPHIVAEAVLVELINGIKKNIPDFQDKVTQLCARAEALYENNKHFRNKVRGRGNSGRDYLYKFMRHWLSAILQKTNPEIYAEIPESFRRGVEIKSKVRI